MEAEIAQIQRPTRPESAQGFVPQRNRRQVERPFGWLNRSGAQFKSRLFKDVEKTIESAEAMLKNTYLSNLFNRMKNKLRKHTLSYTLKIVHFHTIMSKTSWEDGVD